MKITCPTWNTPNMKRRILSLLLTSLLFTGAPSHAQSDKERSEILALITELARLTDMADACGEHMNYFGKKALEGAVCKEFEQAFYQRWASREALQQVVSDYTVRLEQGAFSCDNCDVMLQRAEELRITVTYYLDYMDFVRTF